jgi:hypothetical protein
MFGLYHNNVWNMDLIHEQGVIRWVSDNVTNNRKGNEKGWRRNRGGIIFMIPWWPRSMFERNTVATSHAIDPPPATVLSSYTHPSHVT